MTSINPTNQSGGGNKPSGETSYCPSFTTAASLGAVGLLFAYGGARAGLDRFNSYFPTSLDTITPTNPCPIANVSDMVWDSTWSVASWVGGTMLSGISGFGGGSESDGGSVPRIGPS